MTTGINQCLDEIDIRSALLPVINTRQVKIHGEEYY